MAPAAPKHTRPGSHHWRSEGKEQQRANEPLVAVVDLIDDADEDQSSQASWHAEVAVRDAAAQEATRRINCPSPGLPIGPWRQPPRMDVASPRSSASSEADPISAYPANVPNGTCCAGRVHPFRQKQRLSTHSMKQAQTSRRHSRESTVSGGTYLAAFSAKRCVNAGRLAC
jgi:hypothetical protein